MRENLAAAKSEAADRYKKGATLRQVAIEHDVTPERVRQWLKAEGVKMRRPGQPRKDTGLPNNYTEADVVNALLQGIPTDRISRFLKVKVAVIRKIGASNGLTEAEGVWNRG